MTSTESDRAYDRRALTRVMRLAERDDLPLEERIRQIHDCARIALERPSGDPEVIAQLKRALAEAKNAAIDTTCMRQEIGLLTAQLAASERARRQLAEQPAPPVDATLARIRLEELGCVLLACKAWEDLSTAHAAQGALSALAKRVASEFPEDERDRRARAALLEMEELRRG